MFWNWKPFKGKLCLLPGLPEGAGAKHHLNLFPMALAPWKRAVFVERFCYSIGSLACRPWSWKRVGVDTCLLGSSIPRPKLSIFMLKITKVSKATNKVSRINIRWAKTLKKKLTAFRKIMRKTFWLWPSRRWMCPGKEIMWTKISP